MELPHREYLEGARHEAFLRGVELVLTKKRMKKIELARLCIKRDEYGRETLISLWGRPERAAVINFSKPIAAPYDFTQLGRLIGEQMENWVDNDAEFERADAKALGLQFNIWETSEFWDRTQDMLDVLERDFQLHINGKLHWRVRKALTELIEMMNCDVSTAVAEALAAPENIDGLRAIAKKAGFALVPEPSLTKRVKEPV